MPEEFVKNLVEDSNDLTRVNLGTDDIDENYDTNLSIVERETKIIHESKRLELEELKIKLQERQQEFERYKLEHQDEVDKKKAILSTILDVAKIVVPVGATVGMFLISNKLVYVANQMPTSEMRELWKLMRK